MTRTHLNVFTPTPIRNDPVTGDVMRMYEVWPSRFRAKVRVGNGCWPWIAYRDANGYGRFNQGNGRGVDWAHRLALKFSGIELVSGLHVDHLCRNRACVRPDHLEQVDARTNEMRGAMSNNAAGVCRRGLHAWVPDNIEMSGRSKRCKPCRVARAQARARMRGVGIHNKLKTQCPHGHPYDLANTRYRKDGSRQCRACGRDRMRRQRELAIA